MTTKTKKEKVNIAGKPYKLDKPVADTLKNMSEAIRSHEVALLTWVHKDYNASGKFEEDEVKSFRKSLYQYSLQIPEANNILLKMSELDDKTEKELEELNNQDKKVQNKEEKDAGTKE
tara:strand:- start:909 stop:1262 length:354 start_codon:yes stop_codon:yes gene_type:complete